MHLLAGLDVVTLIKAAGYIGVFFIIFAESGLFFGFFLPGDSLLFTAGFLASQGYGNILVLATLSIVAAIAGDSVGYAFGRKVGPAIFRHENSFFFNKEYIERARAFYAAHGKKTIILARFMPIVRTFAPIIAGVGGMDYPTFFSYNIIGGIIWGGGMTILGYFLGSVIPNADKYLLPIVVAIIIVSFLPGLIHLYQARRQKNH